MLAVRLDNIMVDDNKIHANHPRFARKSMGVGLMDKPNRRIEGEKCRSFNQNSVPGGSGVEKGSLRGNKSYATTVVGGSSRGGGLEEVQVINYLSNSEDIARWSKACIGEVLYQGESYNLQTHFQIGGFFYVKIIPLGENMCVLEEMEEGVILDLMSEGNSWWKLA